MWIIMKKTYSGVLGYFFKGQRYDLLEATVKKLGKRFCKECPAPWDEQKDEKAVKLAEQRACAGKLKAEADVLAADAKALREIAEQLAVEADSKEKQVIQLRKDVKTAKGQKAKQLEARIQRAELELQFADGKAQAADAEAQLRELEARDAQEKATNAEEALEAGK